MRHESSWREDHRRISNGDQTYRVAGLAMRKRVSNYGQQHIVECVPLFH
jgi:hypothetical protein